MILCYAMQDGNLILCGIANHTKKIVYGSLIRREVSYTKGKKLFTGGKSGDMRPKSQAAKGAWPAIRMLSRKKRSGPKGGE